MGEISQLYYNIGECGDCGVVGPRNRDDVCEMCDRERCHGID